MQFQNQQILEQDIHIQNKQNLVQCYRQNSKRILQNKTLIHLVKTSIHKLQQQFSSNNYDINSVMKEMRIYLSSIEIKYQQKKQDQQENQIITFKQIQDIIWPEFQIFLWHLSISPKYWISLLQNQSIYSQDTQTIDLHLFTSKIFKKIKKQSQKTCKLTNIFFEIASDQIYFLLQEINIQICQLYHKGKQIIIRQIQEVTQLIKQSKMINFYVLFKILMDISNNCYKLIQQQLQEGLFAHTQPSYIQIFSHYILQKHQVLSLTSKPSNPLQSLSNQSSIIQKIQNSNKIKWHEVIRQDGQIGIFVSLQQQSHDDKQPVNQNYILKLNKNGQIDIMNCNSIRKKWQICQQKSQNTNILSLIANKKKLASKLRNSPTQIKTLSLSSNISTIGGSLGKCLADIKKYSSASEFIMDLSKGAAISGTFNYLIYNVPIIGYLFVTGGYTYSFYSIFSNKYSTVDKKIKEMGNLTIDTASSIGSGIIGALIGQTLIPLPVVGAFFGGVVGGFIGEIGGKKLSNYLENSRFQKTIQGLKNHIKIGGYWDTTPQTLACLNIKREQFYSTIPTQLQKRVNCDRLWLTLICFTLYSFSESKCRKRFMQKSMSSLKCKKQKSQTFDISFQQYKHQYEYQPTLDMQCITKFLDYQGVQYVSCLKQMEEFMAIMYSRIV